MLWRILSVCLCLAAIDCPNTDVNIEAVPGENVSLFSTSDRTWTSFECRKDLIPVVLYRQNKIMPQCCPLFEGRVSVSTEGNLSVVLTNVTHKDSGVYTCELLDSREKAKRPRVFSIILKVAENVKIDAKPGDDVTLFSTPDLNWTSFECSTNSSLVVKFSPNKTMPEYGPKFKGRVSVSTEGNLSVVLTNVTHKDSGVYTCELLDSREKAKRPRVFSIILKVPENVTIDAEPGDNVTLFSTPDLNWTSFECSTNSSLVVKFSPNKTMPEYGPKFKGRVSVSTEGNLSVVLTNVTYNDSGVYTCDLEPPRVLNIILTVAGLSCDTPINKPELIPPTLILNTVHAAFFTATNKGYLEHYYSTRRSTVTSVVRLDGALLIDSVQSTCQDPLVNPIKTSPVRSDLFYP